MKFLKALRVFIKALNDRDKCTCKLNNGKCAKVVKVSNNGVISMEGYTKCAKFMDKYRSEGEKIRKIIKQEQTK